MMPATIPTDFYQYVDGLRTDIIVDCAHTPIWWDGEVFRFGEDGRPSQSAIETLVTGIAIRDTSFPKGTAPSCIFAFPMRPDGWGAQSREPVWQK